MIDTSQKPGTELLSDLANRITQLLQEHIGEDRAADIGQAVAEDMAQHWGGQLVYFPKGKFLILSKRDRHIYAEFNGRNHADLARKYDVSVQHIYRIIKIMTRRDLDERHDDLFADHPS